MRMLILLFSCLSLLAQGSPDWSTAEPEALRHYQALLRIDTADPPGNEAPAVDYLRTVLQKDGIPTKTFATDPKRPNLVARLKGSGKKKPLLIMAHTDVVGVQPEKWIYPPFAATLTGGYIYGRGAVDDKDNLAAGLMTMILLKRQKTALDRDVIFLAEAGEEGSVQYGIKYMVENHWPEIEAEYCIAEGGGVYRRGGALHRNLISTTEKNPNMVRLIARGPAGHGSRPLPNNAVVALANAVAKVAAWQTPMRLNDTTRAYFERLATISKPEEAGRYNGVVNPARSAEIQEHFRLQEPMHYSMLRTSISPTILKGGFRRNVIPSEAEAALDVRVHPSDNLDDLLTQMRKIIGDASVEVVKTPGYRPLAPPSSIDNEMFRILSDASKRIYPGVTVLPVMSTGATDKVFLQLRGVQSYGIGSATDEEDGPKGFGAHSDQERLLESEFHRFLRYNWEVVTAVAGAR